MGKGPESYSIRTWQCFKRTVPFYTELNFCKGVCKAFQTKLELFLSRANLQLNHTRVRLL
jgi:hypothetical protein